MNFIDKMVEQFMRVNRRMKRWQRVVSVLAAIVVFVTTYSLVLPAITLDKETASAQAGIEVAASENESGSDGTVYEAEPESEPEAEPAANEAVEEPVAEQTVEEVAEAPAEEDSSSESGSEDAAPAEGEKSEEPAAAPEENTGDNEADHTENTLTAEEAANYATTEEAIAAVTGQTAEEIKLITEQTQLTFDADSYTVYADFDESAKLPEGVKLQVKEITEKSDPAAYQKYYEKALSEVQDKYDENTALSFASFYDIAFVYEGVEIEPSGNVNVRIEYKTAVDVQSDANVEAIHFDKNNGEKAEVIDSDTEGSADKVDAVAFESDQFSVYGVVGTTPGVEIAMMVGQTETIEPDLSSYYNRYSWTTSDASVVSIKAGSTSENVTIEAKKEGTAQVVLTYVSGKGKKETRYRAYYQVTVAALNDTDVEAQEYSADGMTVSVEDTGRMKKLSDYHVVVEDADSEFTDADVLKAYHIYLADAQGNEISAADLGNGTLNLKVAIKYDELPDWFQDAHGVKHYKNGKEQSINAIKFDVENKEISFIVHGFSSFTITSGSTVTTGGGQSITTQQGSILDGMTFDDANEWQIVDGEYTNNAADDKTPSKDGNIRVQKNIIPTEVENEFYVYLSIDTRLTEEMMTEILKQATYKYGSSQHFPEPTLPRVNPNSSSKWGDPGDTFPGVQGSVKDDGDHDQEIKLYHDGVYVGSAWAAADCSNYQVYLVLGQNIGRDPSIGVADQRTGYQTTVELSDAAYTEIINYYMEQTYAAVLNSVEDQLGPYMQLIPGTFTGDFSAEPSVSGDTITWIPSQKANPVKEIETDGNKKDVWSLNVAELRYRVRLDVTKEGFQSCAESLNDKTRSPKYDVNDHATLTYDNTETTDFPVPTVRGLLYDFKIKKVDQDGKTLPGAKFSLTGTSYTTGTDVAQQEAQKVPQSQLISGEDGYVTVTGLPWGTYTITETEAPKGYRIDDNYKNGKEITLCQTTDAGVLANNNTHRILKDGVNDYLTVVNKLNKITFTKKVDAINDLTVPEVDHTIYIALWHGGSTGDYLRDENNNIIYREIVITDGVPNPATVTFDEGIESDFYDVYELAAVSGSSYTDLHVGHDILVNSEGREFQLVRIDGENDADLLTSNEAAVTLTNVYSDPTNIPFDANKKWASPDGNELETPPAGATVTFALFRRVKAAEGQPANAWTPYMKDGAQYQITLNGTESVPWRATFEDLPIRDENDNSIIYEYAVKETDCSSVEFQLYDKSSGRIIEDPDNYYMNINGGNIWNIQKVTSIIVKKEDNENHFLPGATFELRKATTGEPLVKTITLGETDTAGVIIDGLSSGDYKLVETKAPNGYVIISNSIVFSVNATGTGDVITWKDGQPENTKPLSGTNNNTITVINTPGSPLPYTGGPGTLLYTLSGLMLILATALMYGFRMRRRERRIK